MSRRYPLTAVCGVAVLTLGVVAGASAEQFTCALKDPTTRQARSVFQAGETVLVEITTNPPATMAEEPVSISASLSARVAGVSLSTDLIRFDLQAPSAAEREAAGGWTEANTELRAQSIQPSNRSFRFTIPAYLPKTQAEVLLKASVGNPVLETMVCRASLRVTRN